MGEADKFLNIMLYWEKIKYTIIGVGMGILALVSTILYGKDLYIKYYDIKEETPFLDMKYTPIIIILFWVISIVLLYFRNNKTFQQIGLFSDIAFKR